MGQKGELFEIFPLDKDSLIHYTFGNVTESSPNYFPYQINRCLFVSKLGVFAYPLGKVH